MNVKINPSWQNILEAEFKKDYFKNLASFVRDEYLSKKIYPKPENLFRAFDLCDFEKIKVVIIGQDPYHGPCQAHGLCFSVQEGVVIPPSLQNIYKEIENDLSIEINKKNGDLSALAEQGVLLLNATLTVAANRPGSHQRKGWEEFTDAVISKVSQEKNNVVFMLWGAYAGSKEQLVNSESHLILKAPHPSPLSAYRGFFGCRHFSRANKYLKEKNRKEINWQL